MLQASRRRPSSAKRRVLVEDGALEAPQLLTRLDAKLVDERSACVLISPKSLGLTPGAVQGEHELGPQALSKRVAVDERFELANRLGVVAECELGFDARLDRRKAELLELCDLGLRERLVREIGQRCAAPELQTLTEQLGRTLGHSVGECPRGLFHQGSEAPQVELVRLDPDQIPAPPRDDPAVGSLLRAAVERPA